MGVRGWSKIARDTNAWNSSLGRPGSYMDCTATAKRKRERERDHGKVKACSSRTVLLYVTNSVTKICLFVYKRLRSNRGVTGQTVR